MRKLSLLLVFAVLAISSAFAQTPEQFKYQAVLRNADGDIMASETVNVNIKILQGAADGTEVFSEDHLNINTSAQGLININIGDTEDLSTIDWANDTYFIKISVNGAELGTSQLLSVPYALNAKTAETASEANHAMNADNATNATNATNADHATTATAAENVHWEMNSDDELYYNGNIGLGTTNPNTRFKIKQEALDYWYGIGLATSTGSDEDWYVAMNNNEDLIFQNDTDNPALILKKNAGGVQIGNHTNALPMKDVIILTGTTDNDIYSYQNLPDGFTNDNCIVFSATVRATLNSTDSWRTENIHSEIENGRVYIKYPDNSNFFEKPYRIVLVKF